ncbi:Ribonuclease H2 subunit A [Talaromyces atroroseus]|uniref:Ribonuclease n=1 Tax=Talaromyces atroroseus TaxID=1441469 RepID=A0A225ADD5_TALAT|nr:Ribonuclease H2 subunit A [Talaromyces atroroseus]OKL59171.1 Ribonuclease H2 subunit A [Talaromyces atroroseus]
MARPGRNKKSNSTTNNISEEAKEALSFIPPTIHHSPLLHGQSYTVYSPRPNTIQPADPNATLSSPTENEKPTPCVLGVDEAGRGPVLGPMVYSAFYLPKHLEQSLLTDTHNFDDSKALTPSVRATLMHSLCTPSTALHDSCGWAVKVLSARDISAGMMRPGMGVYNLNAQAMDATIEIIKGVLEERHIDVKEVYIDTIGNPATYQQKLQRLFPTLSITVAKKADSLYPCVSAASVVAKVTRDVALDVCYEAFHRAVVDDCNDDNDHDTDMKDAEDPPTESTAEENGWGSGYPSDSKCVSWLRQNLDSVFGWGNECRFSWGTAKEMLEGKDAVRVDWPADEDEGAGLADFLLSNTTRTPASALAGKHDDVSNWYGTRVGAVF